MAANAGHWNDNWPAGGATGTLLRAVDWSCTPLGPMERWPENLKTCIGVILGTSTPMGIYWGADHVILYNDAWRALIGTKHPYAFGKPAREAIPEVWHAIGPILQNVMLGNGAAEVHDQLLSFNRSGQMEDAWFTYTCNPVAGENGLPAGILTILTETTEQRRANAALCESEVRLRALVEASSNIIYRTSPDWSEVREIYGRGLVHDRQTPNQSWLAEYVHPDDRSRVIEGIEEAIRTKSTYEMEHRVLFADGATGWILSRAVPILDASGNIIEWFGTASDVTARKQAEVVLRSARDEAERAQAAAEEANRAKSRFLAAASHDLRQPVMAAGLYLGLLEQRVRDHPEVRGLVDMVSLSLEGLRGMLNGLLEMARLEAGIVEPKLEAFALDELLQRLAGEFGAAAGAARLWLRVPPTGAVVRSDRLLLELVLRNLISNAVKYTQQGGVAVECVRQDGCIRIDVADTGPGIAPEQMGRVFEDFVQVGEENRSIGFGIGLATVRRAADLLGHRVDVRSQTGQGSTFSVWVPDGRQTDHVQPAASPAEHGPLPARTALVVEDDRMVAAALCMALDDWGVAATVAHSVREARAAVAGRRFDLVVSDFQLPDGNGFDAITAARDGGTGTAVLLTGDTRPDTLRRAHEAGLRLLTKPVDVRALRATVRELAQAAPTATND